MRRFSPLNLQERFGRGGVLWLPTSSAPKVCISVAALAFDTPKSRSTVAPGEELPVELLELADGRRGWRAATSPPPSRRPFEHVNRPGSSWRVRRDRPLRPRRGPQVGPGRPPADSR